MRCQVMSSQLRRKRRYLLGWCLHLRGGMGWRVLLGEVVSWWMWARRVCSGCVIFFYSFFRGGNFFCFFNIVLYIFFTLFAEQCGADFPSFSLSLFLSSFSLFQLFSLHHNFSDPPRPPPPPSPSPLSARSQRTLLRLCTRMGWILVRQAVMQSTLC